MNDDENVPKIKSTHISKFVTSQSGFLLLLQYVNQKKALIVRAL